MLNINYLTNDKADQHFIMCVFYYQTNKIDLKEKLVLIKEKGWPIIPITTGRTRT